MIETYPPNVMLPFRRRKQLFEIVVISLDLFSDNHINAINLLHFQIVQDNKVFILPRRLVLWPLEKSHNLFGGKHAFSLCLCFCLYHVEGLPNTLKGVEKGFR